MAESVASPNRPTIPQMRPKTSAAENAYQVLERSIVRLELPPGAVLTESFLMQQLGLSRTPLREALQRLAQDHLVVILPRRGILISEISLTDLQSVFEVRVQLEELCGRLAAQRVTPEEVAELEGLFEGTVAPGNRDDDVEIDREFHRLVLKATRNPYLEDTLSRTHAFSLRLLYLSQRRMDRVRDTYEDYLEIIRALKNRDSAAAGEGLRRHAQALYQSVQHSFYD
jgi:DNA-binding GntR family transcriptional regulator